MENIIGIIGCGNMGGAIVACLEGNLEYQIWAYDKDATKTKGLPVTNVADNPAGLVNAVDSLILAIKPQDFDALLVQIKQYIDKKLIISIAAGISTGYIENKLGKIRLIRAMPNLAAKVQKAMVWLSKGRYSSNEDLEFCRRLFNCLGKTLVIDENMMNAATAISGSGPGFLFDLLKDKTAEQWQEYAQRVFVPQLSEAAQGVGFIPEMADAAARATAAGSMALLRVSGQSPAELCKQVASKGGTTEAGLAALHRTGSLIEAAKAAVKRAEELARE